MKTKLEEQRNQYFNDLFAVEFDAAVREKEWHAKWAKLVDERNEYFNEAYSATFDLGISEKENQRLRDTLNQEVINVLIKLILTGRLNELKINN